MKFKKLLDDNLLYLSLLSFVLVSTTALLLTKQDLLKPLNIQETLSRKTYSPIPVLSEDAASFPILSAQAVLAIDLKSGKTLFEKNPNSRFLPASTTKIITALVAMDYYSSDTIIKVDGVGVEGQKMGLIKGEEISVEDLLYGLLIFSANDAAETLAENYCELNKITAIPLAEPYNTESCGRDTFILAMNEKVKELHLENSYFVNPSGLDDPRHVSTAKDLVRVAKYAMENPYFAKIVATKELLAQSVDGKVKHRLVNINELIGEVEGVLGIKTGWTESARENLITYIKRDDKEIIIALLGSQDRFGETKELINWMFNNYEWKSVEITLRNNLK